MTYTAERTSGENRSYWIASTEIIEFGSLEKSSSAEVVIIGGGISGLTTAYMLSGRGKSVILLDDGYIGSGETGRTTAHLVNALDDRYYELENLFGEEYSKLAAESHTAAVNMIEKIVNEGNIDCNFMRLDGYLFRHPTDDKENMQKEYDAARRAGIDVSLINNAPGISGIEYPVIRFPRQAAFHPLKYLKGLCNGITKNGGKIYTLTRVEEILENGVKTDKGLTVNSDHIVVAANTPFHRRFVMHTKQAPYRTFVIAAKIKKDKIPCALWWDTGDHKSNWPTYPYHYVRMHSFDDSSDLLIVGGEDHKTGQANEEGIDEEMRYKNLAEWAKLHFPSVEEVMYRWSGQVLEPVDDLAFIGKEPAGQENVYMITGDSGNGMTHGTLGGIIISDLINNVQNKWAELYSPSRKTLKSADVFIEEQLNVAKQYLDYIKPGEIESVNDLKPDSGAIISKGTTKAAVYKDKDGNLSAFSAVCPHLKCIVSWNSDEKTFDCPCHGSRFSNTGKVINGPANQDLEPLDKSAVS